MSDHHVHTDTEIEDERWVFVVVPEATVDVKPYASEMRIKELNPTLGLEMGFCVEMKYDKLSKILAKMLPPIITPPHKNIFARSPIGTGKSTAIVAAILFRVDPKLNSPQAICIVENGYLAIQIRDLLLKMGRHCPITCVLGIPSYKADFIPIPKMSPVEAQVIIGTPFTIQRWIAAKKLVLGDMKMLLIDNVDHVLAQPGYRDLLVMIMKDISKRSLQYQVIMCSTISNDVVEAFVSKTKQVLSTMEVPSLDYVKQYKVNVPDKVSKLNIIQNKILDRSPEVGQILIYVHTKESTRMVCEALEVDRVKFKTIDVADTQEHRGKILNEFEEKQFQVLISTEILDWVGLVIFYDLSIISDSSSDLEQYSRCICRAGKLGKHHKMGAVLNLMCGDMDKMIMEKIEMHNNVTEVLWTSNVQFEDALKQVNSVPGFGIS